MGEPADQRLTINLLELVELRGVDHARDDVAHVKRLAAVDRHHPVYLLRCKQRLARLAHVQRGARRRLERCDDTPCYPDRMRIVLRIVIGDTGLP